MNEAALPVPENATSGRLLEVESLARALDAFARERDWQKFHNVRGLCLALVGEVGELAELFRWMTDEEAQATNADPALRRKVENELADVMKCLVRLSDVLGVDLNAAVLRKLSEDALKYPVELCRGVSTKYTQL